MKVKPEDEIELIDESLKDIETILSLIPTVDMKVSHLNRYIMNGRYLKNYYLAMYSLSNQLKDYKLDLEIKQNS
jgi:hypothetical protein